MGVIAGAIIAYQIEAARIPFAGITRIRCKSIISAVAPDSTSNGQGKYR
jgi:hypothetical protein